MKWLRYEEGFKSLHMTMGVALVFLLMALIYFQVTLAACFATIFVIGAVQNMYYKNVGKDLLLLPLKNQTRFLVGSETVLILKFKNGRLPIWNGTLTLSIEDSVIPAVEEMQHFSGIFDFKVPFSIGSYEEIQIKIPLEGRKRGLSRITRVVVEVPHVFGEGSIMMELEDIVNQENLVYPKIIPFTGELNPSPFKPGEVPQRQSLYQDVFQPVGTRDYVPSDRFDQIHWTASARMQKLQTKEYLPVTEQSVLFVVNAIEKLRTAGDFEKKIERLASYVDYCTRHAIPYEIIVNIRTFGTTPYIHQATGTGKLQHKKSLEMLAQLSERNAKIPFENILQSVEMKGELSPTIVLITHEPERYQVFTGRWSKLSEVIIDHAYEGSGEEWSNEELKETVLD